MTHAPFTTDRELTTFRSGLRQKLITAREALPPDVHQSASQAIEARLEPLLLAVSLKVLAFCWPFRAEFDARPVVARLLHGGVRAALPVVVAAGAPMSFREWTAAGAMIEDRYGIHIPAQGEELDPDLILMPVNAFDAKGFRLGYGGGFFDRTLAARQPRPLALGVGFELARVETIYPQAHDLPLDAVVTEAGIFLPDGESLRAADAESAAEALDARRSAPHPRNIL